MIRPLLILMAITVTNLQSAITHALGGAVASQLNTIQIINEAGRHLCGMHPWRLLIRPPTTLNFTAAQAYVALPADFGQNAIVKYNENVLTSFLWGTPEQIAEERQANRLPPAHYIGCIVQPTQAAVGSAPPVQRIELAPTPAANLTAALSLWYRAAWTEITTGTDVPNLPIYCDSLMTAIVRAVAKGYEEDDIEGVDERLARLMRGAIFETAVQRDSNSQDDYGYIGMGAASREPRAEDDFSLVPDPS
jgi:hypothetical protein